MPASWRGWLLVLTGLGVVAVVVTLAGAEAYINAQLDRLPAPGSAPVLAKSTVIYDRNGKVLAERNAQGSFHVVLGLKDMGDAAPAATLAAEDRDFYHHGALDGFGIMRALAVDTVNHQPLQGGSTITQQLVKIETGQPEKTFTRKVREALIANAMERRYSKDQILELYLNRVYYGHGAYGIGAATKTYFGADKQVKDLSAGQAAFLAGLLTAPSTNDPQTHYDAARARELDVLKGMVATGVLTQQQADAAAAEDIQKALKFDQSYAQTVAPHFVDYVLSQLESQFGAAAVQQGGFAVHTTLDADLQAKAEAAVREGVRAMGASGVNNGMLLAARPGTGELLAWAGLEGIGAIRRGALPAAGGFCPNPAPPAGLAAAMGVRIESEPSLATAIGGNEVTMFDHVQGYQVFANEGRKMPLVGITSINTGTGAVLFQVSPGQQDGRQQVLAPEEAYLVTDVLKGYQSQWGLGWQRQMAGKSGTSGSDGTGIRDAWMMAYNPDIVVGAWAGNTSAGGGTAITTYGVDTGRSMLGPFINSLEPGWNHWYTQPRNLVARRGELYLAGTDQPDPCGRNSFSDTPSSPGAGSPRDKKRRGGGGGGGG